jgi:citronellol/citronellal dehydrogenase
MNTLKNKTLFITGASRGIGKAIALRAAAGANIAILGKTAEPHPKLPGTVFETAKEVEKAGGKALPLVVDIRFEEQVQVAVDKTVREFGGIDILINNASAISLTPTLDTPLKRFDLMYQINGRGTFLCSKLCIPYLKKGSNPHILVMAPPLNLDPKWFKDHLAYTIAKYSMSLCVLGLSAELAKDGIAVNALWPKTLIATDAILAWMSNPSEIENVKQHFRKPEIVADAAYEILQRPSRDCTGNFFIDEEILQSSGTTNFSHYALDPTKALQPDLFL